MRRLDKACQAATAHQAAHSTVPDITPDRFSTDAYALWLKDPKALERQFAAF